MIKVVKAVSNFRKLTVLITVIVMEDLLYLRKGSQFEHNLYLRLNTLAYLHYKL